MPDRTGREVERKFAIHPAFEPPAVDGVEGIATMREERTLDLRAIYFDTADLRLARHGITLRHRTGDLDGARWTLKLPAGMVRGALSRDELEFIAPAGRVPNDAADLVTAYARRAPLTPVSDLRTRRRVWILSDEAGVPRAELVQDEVSVMSRRRIVSRFWELELEDRGIGTDGLAAVGSRLRDAGAVDAEPIPKVVRALGPSATAAPDVAAATDAGSASDALRAALARSVRQLMAHDAGVRLGDDEAVHQMRVATRRLRSDLRTFGALVEGAWAESLRQPLGELADALGAVRDTDVLLARLEVASEELRPSLDRLFGDLAQRRESSRAALLARLRTPDFAELVDRLVDAARGPLLTPGAEQPPGEVLPALVDEAFARLPKRARRLSATSPEDAFHELRIRAKRARYAAEAIGPTLSSSMAKRADRLAGRLADLQSLLGDLHDISVAVAAITATVEAGPPDAPFAFAAGRLMERLLQDAADMRSDYRSTWRRVRRAAERWAQASA